MREIALVGNGPLAPGAGARIDAACHVVRFNRTRGFGGPAGTRLDDLFLINCGGQMHEWLHDRAFWTSPALRAARAITLPVAADRPERGLALWPRLSGRDRDGVNFERDVHARLPGGRVRTLPDATRRAAIAALAALGPAPEGPVWPSTGFLALFHYDRVAPPEARLTLHGYGFQGARCHPWARERLWAERRAEAGRVHLDAAVMAAE